MVKPENSTPCAKPDFGVKNADLEEKLPKTGNCRLHVYFNNNFGAIMVKTFSYINVKHK